MASVRANCGSSSARSTRSSILRSPAARAAPIVCDPNRPARGADLAAEEVARHGRSSVHEELAQDAALMLHLVRHGVDALRRTQAAFVALYGVHRAVCPCQILADLHHRPELARGQDLAQRRSALLHEAAEPVVRHLLDARGPVPHVY